MCARIPLCFPSAFPLIIMVLRFEFLKSFMLDSSLKNVTVEAWHKEPWPQAITLQVLNWPQILPHVLDWTGHPSRRRRPSSSNNHWLNFGKDLTPLGSMKRWSNACFLVGSPCWYAFYNMWSITCEISSPNLLRPERTTSPAGLCCQSLKQFQLGFQTSAMVILARILRTGIFGSTVFLTASKMRMVLRQKQVISWKELQG